MCVYVRNSINFERKLDLECDELELITIEIKKPNSNPFLVTTWYRPPKSPIQLFNKFEEIVDFIAIQCDQGKVDMILKYIVDVYKGSNSLIILENCAACQDIKNRVSELVRLAFSARHFNLPTIVITQQLTSTAKPYRENISKLVTFYNPNRNDMKTIMDDYLYGVSNDEIKDIVDKLKNNKYTRSEINLRHPYGYNIVIPQIK